MRVPLVHPVRWHGLISVFRSFIRRIAASIIVNSGGLTPDRFEGEGAMPPLRTSHFRPQMALKEQS